ncbi:MAG: tol-pal system protein YbgF [Oceanidesulfovibrio sp.]
MDFRLANLETQVMELEEQNRRQAAELDARLERVERYAVAQGVEQDRIRAAIAASRNDFAAVAPSGQSPNAQEPAVVAETAKTQDAPEASAEDLAVEIETGQTNGTERVHPVSRPKARSSATVTSPGPGPDTPYSEPGPDTRHTAAAASPEAAARTKPTGNGLPWDYTEAVRLTRSGNTEKGRQMLRAFLMEHPDSPLVPNAYYWLGETYYHDKRYAQAILTFKEVTSRFPKDPKAAASMLKIGYSYEMLGDKANARFYLNALIEDYPKSEPAKLARNALDERF